MKSIKKIQGLRGVNDILPKEAYLWQYFEKKLKDLANDYGYNEIKIPIIEKSNLFHRSVGKNTDIIEKETYSFKDRNGEDVTLRPEGTAGCVRSTIEHKLLARKKTQKLWYMGPMYRYERPQKGRYRQFHQFGIEVYGNNHISQDAELLNMSWRLWKNIGLEKNVLLQINNIGTLEERKKYTEQLVKYLKPLRDKLNENDKFRLDKNPLRILDSNSKETQMILKDKPILSKFISPKGMENFNNLCKYLKESRVPVIINDGLVRGLDYYSNTVFEWTTNDLGAQKAICSGGRYNKLFEDLGEKSTPAVGFAIGIERIILLIEKIKNINNIRYPDIYIISDKSSVFRSMKFAENARNRYPYLKIEQNFHLGKIKSQFKEADQSGAKIAIIICENECKNENVRIKFLRDSKKQIDISENDAIVELKTLIF